MQVKLIRHTFKSKATNKKFTPIQIDVLRRRGKLVNTSTSVKGRRAAFAAGRTHGFETTAKFLGPGAVNDRSKLYAGTLTDNSVRTRATAEAVKRGIKSVGGQVYEKIRARKSLPFEDQVTDLKRAYAVIEKVYGNDEAKALRAYLDGNTLEGTMISSKKVARRFMRRIAVGMRAELMKQRAVERLKSQGASPAQIKEFLAGKQSNMLNFSHSWGIDAVVEALSNRKIESFSPGGVIRELEGVHFDIKPNKVLMTYRGETFNVTDKLRDEFPTVLKGVFDREGRTGKAFTSSTMRGSPAQSAVPKVAFTR